jgi:hypothetical protein
MLVCKRFYELVCDDFLWFMMVKRQHKCHKKERQLAKERERKERMRDESKSEEGSIFAPAVDMSLIN